MDLNYLKLERIDIIDLNQKERVWIYETYKYQFNLHAVSLHKSRILLNNNLSKFTIWNNTLKTLFIKNDLSVSKNYYDIIIHCFESKTIRNFIGPVSGILK